MNKARACALAFLSACLASLAAQERLVHVDFSRQAGGFQLAEDGYTPLAFRLAMRTLAMEDGRSFLCVRLARPYGEPVSWFIVEPVEPPGVSGTCQVSALELTLYGTLLPCRLGVLLADGKGTTREYGFDVRSFSGPRTFRLTVGCAMDGVVFRGLAFYLDQSVPAGEHVFYLGDLVVLGGPVRSAP